MRRQPRRIGSRGAFVEPPQWAAVDGCKVLALEDVCTKIADVVVPEYRDGKRSYSCTGRVAKRWQAAWDGACLALGRAPEGYRSNSTGGA